MSGKTQILTEATAAFDIGSTSTRACVFCSSRRHCIEIENKDISKAASHKHDPGDFTSTGYPFDDDNRRVYLGEQSDPERCAISLKYAFYILADASDELVGQYALVEPLRKQMHEGKFRMRLRRGLVDLLSKVWKQIEKLCQRQRLNITTISLSVPAQWMDSSGKFIEVYEDIMREVVGATSHDKEFCFVTETEALAHYLLKDHLEELRRNGHRGEHSSFLFLDFGGHNMNGCIFNVVYGEDHVASFYRVGEAFGAGGGSEQWSYNVSELCIKRTEDRTGHRMTAKKKQELVDMFDRFKDSLGPGFDERSFEFEGAVISPQEIGACFDIAHDKVLKLAESHIAALSEFQITDNTVVVAGGTAKHAGIKQRLLDMCLVKRVSEPVFVNVDLCVRYDSVKIAKGAAYSASTKISIGDFLQQGAAFGIQRKAIGTGPSARKNKQVWEDSAEILFSKDKKDALDLNFATGCDEFKIICDPFFGRTASTRLFYDRCYDVLYLGKLKRGGARITMSLEKRDGKDFAVLQSEWASFQTKGVNAWASPGFTSSPLPLNFDCGSSCFFIDDADLDFQRFLSGGTKIGKAASKHAKLSRQDDSTETPSRPTLDAEGSQPMIPIDGRPIDGKGIHDRFLRPGVPYYIADDPVASNLPQQSNRREYSTAAFEVRPVSQSPASLANTWPAPVARMAIETQDNGAYQQSLMTSQPAPVAQMVFNAQNNSPRDSRDAGPRYQSSEPSLSPPKRSRSELGVTHGPAQQSSGAQDAKRQKRYERDKERGVSDAETSDTELSDTEFAVVESSDYDSGTSDDEYHP